ncbi:MAG TPA: phosphatidate cytidylyltransferase [Ideonella sp.]|nr:phosphatidate cytidylyltransferase [Ideonella sp.]
MTAAVLIAAFVAVLFLLPPAVLAVFAALLVAAAGHEWGRLCRLAGARAWIYGVLIAVAFAALYVAGEPALRAAFLVAAIFWLAAAPVWLWRGVQAPQRIALLIGGFLVLVPAGLALASLQPSAVLAVLVLVWVADTAAYFVGRSLGRHKLAPSISPGKTWEGAVGGVLGALAYAIICTGFVERIAWLPLVAGAAALAALSIVGDLFESAAKRQAGVKDSGALLPGHGGILDRIDSATAVLPLAALLLSWVRANG